MASTGVVLLKIIMNNTSNWILEASKEHYTKYIMRQSTVNLLIVSNSNLNSTKKLIKVNSRTMNGQWKKTDRKIGKFENLKCRRNIRKVL